MSSQGSITNRAGDPETTTVTAMAQQAISLLLLSLFLASSAFGLSETAFIVAHKRVSLTNLKSHSDRLSVSIDIYNRGSTAAYDITLSDDSWDKDVFQVVTGNTSRSWEKIEAGSELSHSFELESDVKIVYHGAPAVITYRIPTKANLQEAYSTPILPLEILADPVSHKKIELAKNMLVKYGSHVSVILMIVLFTRIITSPSKKKKN